MIGLAWAIWTRVRDACWKRGTVLGKTGAMCVSIATPHFAILCGNWNTVSRLPEPLATNCREALSCETDVKKCEGLNRRRKTELCCFDPKKGKEPDARGGGRGGIVCGETNTWKRGLGKGSLLCVASFEVWILFLPAVHHSRRGESPFLLA